MLRLASPALPALLFLVSCGRPQEIPDAGGTAASAASVSSANARVEKELKLVQAGFEKRQAESIRKNEELVRANDELKSKLEKVQDEAARTREDFETYAARYKISLRTKTKGLELPRIETLDRGVFEKIVVREVTPTEVAFSHSGGVARIPLAKLTRDLQEKFLYDPEEVKAIASAQGEDAEAVKDIQKIAGVTLRDPTRPVNSLAVKNLTKRIVTRQDEILKLEKEAREVKASAYGSTNIATYRVEQLGLRVTHLKNEISALRNLLDRELNGPPHSAGGP